MERTVATLLVALVTTGAMSGCAAQRHTLKPGARPLPMSAADTDRLFGERLNAGDLDGLVALYEPTATLVRQDGTAATGTTAIREELAAAVALKPQITMNVIRVVPDGADTAVVHNDWHATGTDRDGRRVLLHGRATEVVHRQRDGSWRFAIDDPDARKLPVRPPMRCAAAERHGKKPIHGKAAQHGKTRRSTHQHGGH